jgi:short-subunit dehydrogenase
MRILLTGAFGNVGLSALEELLARGHQVRCFDLRTPANLRLARRYQNKAEVFWGDMRSKEDVAAAVRDVDVVIHLAFILPRLSACGVESEKEPVLARQVNVGGTRTLIRAMRAQPVPPRLIFSSSLHVYGMTQQLPPPRTVEDRPRPVEHYARHKIICERMVRISGLQWSILRFGAVLPLSVQPNPGMYDVPLGNRIEFVHTHDVGLALANAVESDAIWGKLLLIGGGPSCQLTYREMMTSLMTAMGIGALPDSVFSEEPFATDWLDTRESEQLLHYQRRTLADFTRDVAARLGPRRLLARIFRPFVRAWLIRQSPYVQQARRTPLAGRVAVVTGASSGIGAATARRLAREGAALALVARRGDRLEELADEIRSSGGTARAYVVDLTEEAERVRLVETIRRELGPIDVLVNNAGTAWYGLGQEMGWATARDMVQLNAAATTHLTLLCLPDMLRRLHGAVVNISSVIGGFPNQGVAVYSGTKSFIDSFTTSLHRELTGTGVRVGVVRPGYVETELSQRSAEQPGGHLIPGKRWAVKPEQVARSVVSMLRHPRRTIYVPSSLRIVPWLELTFGWLIDRLGPLLIRRQRRLARRGLDA